VHRTTRRKAGRLIGLLAVSVTLLAAGCTAEEEEEEVPDVTDVTVSEDTSAEPEIEFTAPLNIDQLEVTTVVEGDGPELAEGDLALIQAVLVDAQSQEEHINTWSSEPRAMHLTVTSAGQGLYTALVGAQPGDRILLKEPPEADEVTTGRVAVLDVLPSKVAGEEIEPSDDLPSVSFTSNGAPSVTIDEDLEVPSELVSQSLVKGEGKQVRAGQTVTMNYYGVRWEDGEVVDTTWTEEQLPRSYQVGVGDMPSGFDSGLLEQRIGSRLMLVLPPEEGYPDEGVTVFIVELLAVTGEPIELDSLED